MARFRMAADLACRQGNANDTFNISIRAQSSDINSLFESKIFFK